MRVLVDTCVWSLAFRRKAPDPEASRVLLDLIRDGRASMIGPIRQELLSGVADPRQFERLRRALSPFQDVPLMTEHFETAADFSNSCRRRGVQGSTTDFLICAVAHLEGLAVLTTDDDFATFGRHLPIRLL